jgi:ABC-type transport system substrate-binding protein
MKRRMSALLCAAIAFAAGAQPAPGSAEPKVFRYPFSIAETGFDPATISDLYSRIVTSHVFEAPYKYDYLARPYKVVPNTAAGMPEVSADFKTWTVRIKPGIYFTDDPAFKGRKRELVAADYAYVWKRFFDPKNASPSQSAYEEEGVLGMPALRDEAKNNKTPFNYEREVEGLRIIDRYTIQFKLAHPRPRFIYILADNSLSGATAREVVEYYGDKISQHPVGTGPFKLGAWRRSSLITLERNPGFREELWNAEPNADDTAGQALLARNRGKRIPLVDRVEVSIIEESQPRWLSFLNGEFDLVGLPLEFSEQNVPNGHLAPALARRGMQLERIVSPDVTLHYYNMEDPVVGGYTPAKVALRRAINLAMNVQREIGNVRRGQAIPAQSMVQPGSFGYDPAYKTENSDYSVARAKALLDLFGYVDRDGDGWRDMPDGSPLVIQYASTPDAISRQFDELWKINMNAIGVKLQINVSKWPEQLKMARAGQLMLWELGYTAAGPDVQEALQILYGPSAGEQNLPRFRDARFDALYERMQSLPDGSERLAALREAQRIVIALAPQKYKVHRIVNDLTQRWVVGYRRPLYGRQFWQYIDIDETKRLSSTGRRP